MSNESKRPVDLPSLIEALSEIDDPRHLRGVRHKFTEMLVISVLAVICGANTFALIHTFAVGREVWLRQHLTLPAGIPSQDTFERVFRAIDPEVFRKVFCGWVEQLVTKTLSEGERDHFAIDGKTSRGTASDAFAALHTVSVYSLQTQLVLTAVSVPEKANEITVLPDVITALAPVGGVISIDAMGCQKNVAATIRAFPGTDYLLALKGNHKKLEADAHWLFAYHDRHGWDDTDHCYACTEEQGHGREEKRECWVLRTLDYLEDRASWKDLNALVRVRSTRTIGQKTSVEERFYLTSMTQDAPAILQATRLHWGIENGLHWVLDVVFKDDASKVKDRNSAQVWITLRQLAIAVLRRPAAGKGSIESKRFKAALNTRYLETILN